MKKRPLPCFDGFIETPFERRFQSFLRAAWRDHRWHVIVAEPGSGKTMGICDLRDAASREAGMSGERRYPVLAVAAPKNDAREAAPGNFLLSALGLPARGHWSERKYLLFELLIQYGVACLITDDAHDLSLPHLIYLKGLIRHRYELVRESTQRKNKLTAICDELFPEFTRAIKDPNAWIALALREQFPTPQALATASLTVLQQLRGGARSVSDLKLQELQRLAAESIGVKDLIRLRSLVLEQGQLIKELRLLREHTDQLESEIVTIVEQAREGLILLSFPGFGPITALE